MRVRTVLISVYFFYWVCFVLFGHQYISALSEFCGALRHDPTNVFVLIQLKRLETLLGPDVTHELTSVWTELQDVDSPLR